MLEYFQQKKTRTENYLHLKFFKNLLEDIEWLHFNLLVCNEKKILNGWENNICLRCSHTIFVEKKINLLFFQLFKL